MNLDSIKNRALQLHQDENGDIPVGQIMVIGLIAIPLVIALVGFKDEILGWLREQYDTFTGSDSGAEF